VKNGSTVESRAGNWEALVETSVFKTPHKTVKQAKLLADWAQVLRWRFSKFEHVTSKCRSWWTIWLTSTVVRRTFHNVTSWERLYMRILLQLLFCTSVACYEKKTNKCSCWVWKENNRNSETVMKFCWTADKRCIGRDVVLTKKVFLKQLLTHFKAKHEKCVGLTPFPRVPAPPVA